jgi:ribosomal protein L11 methyltransferase
METYTELTLEAGSELQEVLIAELSELQFDNFTQEDDRVTAYTLKENFEQVKHDAYDLVERYKVKLLSIREVENNINWNQKWEENFEPIVVGSEIYVRALFHPDKEGFRHRIIIQPKMSFGTGHHETTQLMLELMLEQDFAAAACLDMGCGTGVLAILAEQLGAALTIAVDYDEWCFDNTQENFELNDIQRAVAVLGDARVLEETDFLEMWLPHQRRILLSNITRNYNLENLPMYHNISQPGTVILLSGFYEQDLEDLRKEAENYGIKFVKSKTKNNWCAAVFVQQ